MNSLFLTPLMGASDAAGAAAGGGSTLMTFIPFILIILIFYFLIIRPQNKKQKETQRMLGALKKGDKVVTIGGLHGTIQSVKENTVIIKADDAVKLEFSRSAVSSVVAESKGDKIEEKKPESSGKKGENPDKDSAPADTHDGSTE